MGLTGSSVGIAAVDSGLEIRRQSPDDKVVALAGNPNVGKSTVFNSLTGLNQHTGNWPGKTVTNAQGYCRSRRGGYVLVDIPGTYSLMAHSAEEEVARNFICFGEPDAVVVVCDATCLERNLNLVLQTLEARRRVVVCVNLIDEAERKGISVNTSELSTRLGVPVVASTARKKKTLLALMDALDEVTDEAWRAEPMYVGYALPVERAIDHVQSVLEKIGEGSLDSRWLALRLLDCDVSLEQELVASQGKWVLESEELQTALDVAWTELEDEGIDPDKLKDMVVTGIVNTAEDMCRGVVVSKSGGYSQMDRKIDRVLTGRVTAYPVMLALLAVVFWLTITGSNYPSQLLSDALFWLQDRLSELFVLLGAPDWLHGVLVLGVYRVLAWVVAVMLPPMAIFFPLFTLLEDAGYLPRVAYNLDKPLKKCCACGKQALTMCMGFGCNAAGVVGCRIIDSPRERLLAILTNSFVPCNGRFPTLIAIISMFFIGEGTGVFSSILSAVLLTAVIALGVIMTLLVTRLLSKTLLKGQPSSFTLELPPYRRPQIGQVIVRSILDRTLFVLGRAVAIAAPAGMLIWLMANVMVGGESLLHICATFLDPVARLFGLDGVILIAFILGLPANEIVVPIIIMAYMAEGSILELESLSAMKSLFVANGWTWITAACTMLFSLLHWPCSTTLLTIKKETGSWKWTALAFALPSVVGLIVCFLFANVARLFV